MSKIDPDHPTFGETPPKHRKRAKKISKEFKEERRRLWRKKRERYRKWLEELVGLRKSGS